MKGRLLSLDISFTNTGWTVFEKGTIIACGNIVTEKSKHKTLRVSSDDNMRTASFARQLHDIILEYDVVGVVGEMPTGGSKSSKAAKCMAKASAIVVTVCELMLVPTEWTDPKSVKIALTGKETATKLQMMAAARKKYKGKGDHLFPKAKKYFEHIADSIGVYEASKTGLLVKLLS